MPAIAVALVCCAGLFPVYGQYQPDRADTTGKRQAEMLIQKSVKELNIPGLSVSVISKGVTVYQKDFGFQNLELKVPPGPQSTYLIASVTKTFTAMAALMLWEEGRLGLDDPVGKYLPALPEHWKPVTVRQLLNHTSGIPTNLETPNLFCSFTYDPEQYTQQNVIQETACLPLAFVPGSRFEYSGRNYFIAGLLIEKIAEMPYGDFLRERIFKPLGMEQTGMIRYRPIIPERVNGYDFENGVFTNSPPLNPVIEFSDGGLLSTIEDLKKWMLALRADRLVKPSTLQMMWTKATLNDGSPSLYGFGFGLTPFKDQRRVGHTGGIPGFSSCVNYFPDLDLIVILLSNTHHKDYNVGRLCNQIAAAYFPDAAPAGQ